MPDNGLFFKRIADPVHGSIGVSRVEAKILESKAFLRLRNVSQLGLASYVYPAANYTRFSHSLGVCHVTGKLLNTLQQVASSLSERDIQQYRLAGLLHDIGHYPFSHAMEIAIKNHYQGKLYEFASNDVGVGGSECGAVNVESKIKRHLSHEDLGAKLLEKDSELCKILSDEGFLPEEIHHIFNRTSPPLLANLVSSDLDADRIDYMLRTSRHTGLPYGNVDVDYLISQMTLDDDNYVCLNKKALRTAEHFLLCRYFDYQQVYFHKTVVGLELVLKSVLQELLEKKIIVCDEEELIRCIETGLWYDFDEISVFSLMRKVLRDSCNADCNLSKKLEAILYRKPPRLVFAQDFFANDERNNASQHNLYKKCVEDIRIQLSAEFNIDVGLWYPWDMATGLTKVAPSVPQLDIIQGANDPDKVMQSIFIRGETGKRIPIMNCEQSLMCMLSSCKLYANRLYVLLDEKKEKERGAIKRRANELFDKFIR